MNKTKTILVNVLIFFIALFLCLAIVEVVLRLTIYNFKPYTVSPGPNTSYPIERAEFKTMVTTNRLNLRDREIGAKSEGEHRILCLGDSFTFGLGVNFEDTYPQQIEKILKQEDPGYRVINGSTGGNAVDALKFLNDKGLSFDPYLVILQVYIGNDFYDGMRYLPQAVSGDSSTGSPKPFLKLKEAVRGFRFCLVDFLWNRLIQVSWIDDWLFKKNIRYGNRAIFLNKYPELETRLVQIELDALRSIQELCQRNNIRLFVMVIPTREQVFKKRLLTNKKYDYRKPNRILHEFFKEKDIEYVDFLDIYEKRPEMNAKPFYYIQDEHWTSEGQAFAAQTLTSIITRRKFRMPLTP